MPVAFPANSIVPGAAAAVCVPGQGTWERTLQRRDYDGDEVADAFYDTELNITWAADAGASGRVPFEAAKEWAAGLRVGGRIGWRLPHAGIEFAPDPDCVANGLSCSNRIKPGTSELEHLYASTLGNRTGIPFNTGLFRNVHQERYFIGDAVQTVSGFGSPWLFDVGTGNHRFETDAIPDPFQIPHRGWAVHDGDVYVLVPIPAQGTWKTALQPRDYDLDGVPDAYYDAELNITWLADAAAIKPMRFEQAMAWAAALSIGGQTGWRLPTLNQQANCNPEPPPRECFPSVSPGSSELEHLYAVTLGNAPERRLNPGPFRHLQVGSYFTDQRAVFIGSFQPAWVFGFDTGRHDVDGNFLALNAWAVHQGDVRGQPP